MNNTKGFLLATAAAALFVSSPLLAQDVHPAKEGKVKCSGVNACKGKAECNTAAEPNSCKGKNACKGKGWVSLSEADCKTQGGTVAE